MSAVGIATTLTMVIRITMVSVTSGAFTLVAQAVGARNRDHASSTAKQALTLVALISVGFGLVGMAISAPALYFFSPSDSVARLGVPYLLVFFAGLVFLGLNYAIHNCLYGAGDTRTPLYLSLLTSAVKLLFSYALIFGAWGLPALGIVGAVTGTIIGQVIGLVVGFGLVGMAIATSAPRSASPLASRYFFSPDPPRRLGCRLYHRLRRPPRRTLLALTGQCFFAGLVFLYRIVRPQLRDPQLPVRCRRYASSTKLYAHIPVVSTPARQLCTGIYFRLRHQWSMDRLGRLQRRPRHTDGAAFCWRGLEIHEGLKP